MTLLQEILDAAVRSDVPLTDLLRRCKVLSSRLRHAELGAWADLELNGYPEEQLLPDYRVLKTVMSKGDFSGPLGSGMKNALIPSGNMGDELRSLVGGADLREPISAYIELVAHSNSGSFQIPWSAELVALTARRFYANQALMVAWREIPKGCVVGLLDTVRNRILNFALAIQEEYPEAGESTRGAVGPNQALVTNVFHTHVTGTIGNLALGNRDISQEYTGGVVQGDMNTLKEYLTTLGVPASDTADLEVALNGEADSKTPGIGKRAATWLGCMTTKAYSGALKVGGAVATKLLETAIQRYLGLPG